MPTSLEGRVVKLEAATDTTGPRVSVVFDDDPPPVLTPGEVVIRVSFVAPGEGRHDDD